MQFENLLQARKANILSCYGIQATPISHTELQKGDDDPDEEEDTDEQPADGDNAEKGGEEKEGDTITKGLTLLETPFEN